MMKLVVALGALSLASAAFAAESGKKYAVETTPVKVKAGEKAKASFRIVAQPGSHVSDEAPLKVELKSEGLKLDKTKMGQADVVEGKGASPRFEVPFTAQKAGAQSVEGDLTFIVCTQQECEREKEHVVIPVSVQ